MNEIREELSELVVQLHTLLLLFYDVGRPDPAATLEEQLASLTAAVRFVADDDSAPASEHRPTDVLAQRLQEFRHALFNVERAMATGGVQQPNLLFDRWRRAN